jgi:hypothetical protein
MIPSNTTMTAAPHPIPALAAVFKACLEDDATGLAVDVLLEVGVICDPAAELDLDTLAVAGIDELIGTPTVAASANTLELIPQHPLSPQHHLFSPQFCTGAFSPCHCLTVSLALCLASSASLPLPHHTTSLQQTHLGKITHASKTLLTLPSRIRAPLPPPIFDSRVRTIIHLEVLAQSVGLAHVVGNLRVACALVVRAAAS